MTAALRDAAALGGFFALVLEPAGARWQPFPGSPQARVDHLAARYGQPVLRRACASTDFLALAARVVAPAVATAARSGTVPVLAAQALVVHSESGALGLVHEVDERPAAHFAESVLGAAVDRLVRAYARPFAVSERVLWGNVASALAGAATVLGTRAARAVVEDALTFPPLDGTGGYDASGQYRRNSCCLYYRLPGGGLCGDCVLVRR